MKNYEIYLTDDQGRRITLLNNIAFLNLSRATRGYGTVHLGVPLADFRVFPYFLPDRRIEVWRAPHHGATLRDEGSYLLRKFNVYTREEDNVQIIEFWGRSPIDILRRGAVTSTTLADYQKTDEIDDMMKDIVQDALITPAVTVPTGEMTVDGSDAQGPIITHSFFSQNILDILNDLRDISFTKNEEDADNNRIYFDVVRGAPLATGGFGYIFRTYASLRGTDRRTGVIFSPENGNVRGPSYYEDHLDSFTQAQILNLSTPAANGSATSPDASLSRWNTIISAQQTSETDANVNDSKAFAVLQDGKADQAFNATFVDSPGSSTQPRSLYGVDWDLGDLLPVRYADKDLSVEVKTVYVSIDENGGENIVGIGELFAETPEPAPGNDEFVVSLLHMNGDDASTTFTDEIVGKVWTANGDAQIDTSQSKFGGASGLFDGTGDWIDTPDHADFNIGSSDFTIDMWVRRTATGLQRICGQGDSSATATTISWYMYFDGTHHLVGGINTGATAKLATSTGTITADGLWHHIAMVRNGNTITLYIDGTADGTVNVTGVTANNSANKPTIGRLGEFASQYYNGRVDEFRFSNGIARWIANFTPPTTEYPNGS